MIPSQTKPAKPQQSPAKARILNPSVEWPAEAFDFSDVETVCDCVDTCGKVKRTDVRLAEECTGLHGFNGFAGLPSPNLCIDIMWLGPGCSHPLLQGEWQL